MIGHDRLDLTLAPLVISSVLLSVVLAIPRPSCGQESNIQSFSGVWDTNFGQLRLHEVEMNRSGAKYLIGDYADRGIILGRVSGSCVAGVFTNGERNGILRFEASESDRFQGQWAWQGEELGGAWEGERTSSSVDQLQNFTRDTSGTPVIDNDRTVYDGAYESRYGTIELRSRDLFLIGDYADKGVIAGMWDGDSFVGQFTNGERTGWFDFSFFSADGSFRSGSWGWIGDDEGSDWSLDRVGTPGPLPTNMVADVQCPEQETAVEDTVVERAHSFDSASPNVSFPAPDEPAMEPLSGRLQTSISYLRDQRMSEYDADLQWQKVSPTGFGLYLSLSTAEVGPNARFDADGASKFTNGGAILARAGGHGGLWQRDTGGGAYWDFASNNLPARFHPGDAVMDPRDKNHILTIVPSDEDQKELFLYETTNGGRSWSKVSYFTRPEQSEYSRNVLNDIKGGWKNSGKSAALHFFENGNVFLFNYNGDHWGYYSTDGGDSWTPAELNVQPRGKPVVQNQVYFTEQGYGLLNPTDGKVYRTADYGKTWTQIGDYSQKASDDCPGGCTGFAFALSDDGQTVYVLYRQEFTISNQFTQALNNGNSTQALARAFQRNGANLRAGGQVQQKNWGWKVFHPNGDWRWIVKSGNNQLTVHTCCYLDTSNDGGQSFNSRNLSKPFPGRGPQGLAVDPDDPSELTAFVYMKGPYVSKDDGNTWTRIYNNNNIEKHIFKDQFYNNFTINKSSSPSKMMAKPVDYRDVMVMDNYVNNPILIGSDQGLFIMSRSGESVSPVSFYNVGSLMDHTVAYNLEVDDCGNVYQGLWHHSSMLRQSTDIYYYGGPDGGVEAGRMILKKKNDCLGWSSSGPKNFKNYASDKSGTLQKYTTGTTLNYKGKPTFFDGEWHYVERSNWNLYATMLASHPQGRQQIASNVRGVKKDRASSSLWYATGYGHYSQQPENAENPNPKQLMRLKSGTSSAATSLDLTDSSIEIGGTEPRYDVHDGRVIAVVQNTSSDDDDKEDILIYDDDEQGTVTPQDITRVENQFGNPDSTEIRSVWVDPTNSDRYFAFFTDTRTSSTQCPHHLMVTMNRGQSWELFSEKMNCSIIWDLAFNPKTETMYAAVAQRGVLKGDLSGLNSGNLLAAWRPGSGAQRWRSGMTLREFKEQDQQHFDNGLRLVDVRVDDGQYAAVWRAGSGSQWWNTGMTLGQFKKQDEKHFDNGQRLVDIEVENGRYTAVWRAGSGSQRWKTSMSRSEFVSQTETYFEEGLRLRDVEVNNGGYTAVWRAGTGAQWMRTGMTQSQFQSEDQKQFDDGLRLVDVEVDEGRYTAVWRAGTGTQWWRSGMAVSGFKSQDRTYFEDGLRLVDLETPDTSPVPTRVGSGTQWWRSGMSISTLKSQDKKYFADGLRLVDIEDDDSGYTAVWRPGDGAQWWRSGMSVSEFETQDETYFDEGFRLTDVEFENGKYTAVWRSGSGGQRWRSGMSVSEFEARDQEHFADGLRLIDVEIDGGSYTAVWRDGGGAQRWRSGMTRNEFKEKDQEYFDQGLRLVDVEVNGDSYAAVWRAGIGPQWWRSGMTRNQFQSQDKTYFDEGLRLIDVEIEGDSFTAVW